MDFVFIYVCMERRSRDRPKYIYILVQYVCVSTQISAIIEARALKFGKERERERVKNLFLFF